MGLEPDMVVATDGGYWSRLHLYPLASKPLPIASPLTALPSSAIYRGSGLLLLDQGSFAESELLPFLCPGVALPPHGTVSGTAIQLAARLTDGPVIVAGLDLASFGDMGHTRPHGFDPVLEAKMSRSSPLESLAWERSALATPLALAELPWRSSRSLSAYASALSLDSAALAGRLFRLGPSPVHLPGFVAIDPSDLGSLATGGGSVSCGLRLRERKLPAREHREEILRQRIGFWRDLAAKASDGMGRGKLPTSPLLTELLTSVDLVDYAAARRAILAGGEPESAALDLGSRCDLFLSALQRRFAP
jgi:hypothetical protein